jgi:hypothetical protein
MNKGGISYAWLIQAKERTAKFQSEFLSLCWAESLPETNTGFAELICSNKAKHKNRFRHLEFLAGYVLVNLMSRLMQARVYDARGGYLGKSQNMLLFACKVQLLTRHFIKLDPT